MELKMTKKAILFTFLSVIIAGLIATMFSTHQITPIDENVDVEKARVTSTNNLLLNIIAYSKTSLKLSGYVALQEMIDNMNEQNISYTEQEIGTVFNETVLKGTINGVARNNMAELTIIEMMEKVKSLVVNETNTLFIYNVTEVHIDQTKPFSVTAVMNISFYLERQSMSWNTTEEIVSEITIIGLKDPVYFDIGYNNTFKETNTLIETFNRTTFEIFVNNSEYINSPSTIKIIDIGTFKPMSFFGRLTNDANVNNATGLTLLSIVDPVRLPYNSTNTSYVDYMFQKEFNQSECLKYLRKVSNISNQPIIDAEHLKIVFNMTDTQEEFIC
ncbi:MAG: hypothetical protein ABH828_02365 [archaeon]